MHHQSKEAKALLASFVLCLSIVLGMVPIHAQSTARVTLTPSQTTWKTVAYELDANNGMVDGSRDLSKIVEHTFDTYILENEYLKVTLLPEYGGRILSMIYKPTGHEELYQNPLGLPYGIGDGNFYYDWLMVYGGIFPTFPEPEHGKGWLVPWTFEVVSETPDAITVSMSLTDDINFAGKPGKFDTRTTGLTVTFFVTLKAGRAALDTAVVVNNPTNKKVNYELWMCTTLAPGSTVGDTRTTAGAEIIAPVDEIKMPPWWPATTAQEQATSTSDVYTFDKLRMFENWADMGIAYAYPDMQSKNFWGVINHDNQEGIIRISDNDVTSGMKIWTWGYNSVEADPFAQPEIEKRPYIELWAGVSSEFFKRTSIAANAEVRFEETYSPTVGLSNVTQASDKYLANFAADAGSATLQVFGIEPSQGALQVRITADGETIYDEITTLDPAMTREIRAEMPAGTKVIGYMLIGEDNAELLTGELTLN
jgi:hypothetical protein